MSRPKDEQTITDTVVRFFHAIDGGSWTTVRALLTEQVEIAHGSSKTTLSKEELASGWERSHATFETTRYELDPVDVELTGADRATARFGSRLTFVRPEGAADSTLVIEGRYTVGLQRSSDTWAIHLIHHVVAEP